MKTALIVDDHPVTHIGCGQLLRDAGYDEVFEALTDREAYRLAEAHGPDLIVLDLGMPGVGGLNMIGPLSTRAPAARILVFTMNEQTVFAAKALEAGARGYLSKNSAPDDFLEAVRTLERDELFLSHKVAVSVASMRIGGKADPLASLTEREHQVLRLIGRGEDLQSIADALCISYKTAANTSSILKRKLGARNTTELVRLAIETGMS
ncbi:response regulator [Rhodovulum euryhalinum]|uniref:LuxR family two component transcriptional regulator n=1 Tax=Rhodovulum euryhalinum TaxID=35805 RepID=A0A4R2KHB0_9RHOB|nr:response regulator transcription factor [Rhodovulum euryhalinum]TCO71737.1 LuxR family two component transcriptional regulator [Rhodovulum euryhalinum]